MTTEQVVIPEQASAVIYETTEYHRFEKPPTGRPVRKKNVDSIKETMRLRGFWDGKALTVRPNGSGLYQIMDGNHRFEAAKELGIPVKYVIDSKFTLHDVISCNKDVTAWTSMDYLHHFAESGLPEYAYIKLFLRNNPHIKLSVAIYTLAARGQRRSAPTKVFRTGSWQMNTQFANQFAAVMKDFHDLVPEISKLQNFNFAISRMMKSGKYNHKRMMKKMAYLRRRVNRCTIVEEYVEMLEEIYNYRTRGKNRVSFQ